MSPMSTRRVFVKAVVEGGMVGAEHPYENVWAKGPV